MEFLALYGDAARTAAGFFWKAGWAFVLGYSVSAMIQAFVPKARSTGQHRGQFPVVFSCRGSFRASS